MTHIALKDILISARQESYRMRHFYVGVEHLFIALLEIKGGLTASILQEQGLPPEYVIDAIRRKVGKGGRHRLWAGTPNTPRADRLLDAARDHALSDGRKEINERDLLIAILEECDSAPTRVLAMMGLADLKTITELARTYKLSRSTQRPVVRIDYGEHFDLEDSLVKEQLVILRRMFYGYARVRVERRLTGGYTGAVLLVVTPIHADNREDAPVVVKIDHVDTILDEAQRYEAYVKAALPPLTARLEDRPVAPETSDMAGLKYTLIAGNNRTARDLRATLGNWEPETLGRWLRDMLYPAFGPIWWRQHRPFRFQVWREYDWLLPPILTLDYTQDKAMPTEEGHVLKFPMRRNRLQTIDYGEMVTVQNFIVRRVDADLGVLRLAIAHGNDAATAYRVEVRGMDLSKDTYYRGEVIEQISGRVWETRDQQLSHAVRNLEPDFDIQADKMPTDFARIEKLPNPLRHYDALLDTYVNGSLSTIHGDLHLGNIMIGPNDSAFLIDFARTRDGHTVFDWACLEVSLLSDLVMPTLGESWDAARAAMPYLDALNTNNPFPEPDTDLARAFAAVRHVREIARDCLASQEVWAEYYVALAMASLRAVTWDTMSIPARRLMLMVCGMSLFELSSRHRASTESETPSPDETDINSRID